MRPRLQFRAAPCRRLRQPASLTSRGREVSMPCMLAQPVPERRPNAASSARQRSSYPVSGHGVAVERVVRARVERLSAKYPPG
jgi:hypothetical protein